MNRPLARPVELAKEYTLPATQNEIVLVNDQRDAGSDEAGLDVTVTIALSVAKASLALRDSAIEMQENIVDNVRIGVFVDRHGGGGMWTINNADAATNNRCIKYGSNTVGDVDEFVAHVGLDLKCSHVDVFVYHDCGGKGRALNVEVSRRVMFKYNSVVAKPQAASVTEFTKKV